MKHINKVNMNFIIFSVMCVITYNKYYMCTKQKDYLKKKNNFQKENEFQKKLNLISLITLIILIILITLNA